MICTMVQVGSFMPKTLPLKPTFKPYLHPKKLTICVKNQQLPKPASGGRCAKNQQLPKPASGGLVKKPPIESGKGAGGGGPQTNGLTKSKDYVKKNIAEQSGEALSSANEGSPK